MNNTEVARARVELDGSVAGEQLKKLEGRAKELRSELIKLGKANDLTGFRKTEAELKKVQKEMKDYGKAIWDVEKVMNNLNGSSLKDLQRLQKQLSSELKNMNRNTKEEIELYAKKAAQLKNVNKEISSLRSLTSAGSSGINRMVNALKDLAGPIGIGAAVTALFSLGKEFFDLSKQMEQYNRKARIVFGESMPEVTAAAEQNAKQMGLTRNEYVRAAANVADLLVPLGFARDQAAELSVNITNLSGALSEWTGGTLDAAQVNEIMTKAMLGETEQLKQLGVVVDQSSKAYNERVKVLMEEKGLTLEQAKAMDILTQIQQKSLDAQTSFNEQGETLLRTQRGIATWWRQMKENMVGYFQESESQKMENQRLKINALVIEMTSANTQEERKKAIWEQLKTLQPSILNGLDQENINYSLLATNLEKYNEQQINNIALKQASQEIDKLNEKIGAVRSKEAESQFELEMSMTKVKEELMSIDQVRGKQVADIMMGEGTILEKNEQLQKILLERYASGEKQLKNQVGLWRYGSELVAFMKEEKDLQDQLNESMDIYKKKYQIITGMAYDYGKGDWFNFGKGPSMDESQGPKPVDKSGGVETQSKVNDELLKRQQEYRIRIINESFTLIEQENIAYEQRLRDAGVFGEEIGVLTEEQLRAREILESQHQENIAKINSQAMSDEILENKKNFDQITILRETAHYKELAAVAGDEEARKKLEKKYQEEEIDRQLAFLQEMFNQLQGALEGQDTFKGIDETILTPEQKAVMIANMQEIGREMAKLNDQKAQLEAGDKKKSTGFLGEQGSGNASTDIFGMTAEDWDNMIDRIKEGNITLEDTVRIINALESAWSSYNQIRSNQENEAMMEYEANVNNKKDLLQKQLDNGLISQESYTARVAALDSDLDKKKKEIAIKQAKREKSLALVNAIVNTAAAVVKMLNNPFPLNLVLAALVGVAGGLEIATIASQPIPQYAKGRYDVIGKDDGKTYNAPIIDSPGTGLVKKPAILVGEQPELIIDPYTTRNLQVNYPDVIRAINMARVPQYASGRYGSGNDQPISIKTELPGDLSQTMANLQSTTNNLQLVLDKMIRNGIQAKLIADFNYINTHNEIADDYQTLKDRSSLKG